MRIDLPERVQVADVEAFATQVGSAERVELDASRVRQLDTATLQWLISLHRGARLTWVGVSSPVSATITRLALSALVGLGPNGSLPPDSSQPTDSLPTEQGAPA